MSLLFCLPLALATYPPMLDYPQHLALATVLAKFHDPLFGFSELYVRYFTKPNSLFEFVVAGLMGVMSANLAGKLLLALGVIATGFSGVALARRGGGHGWMGLVALPIFYSHVFYWGFVGNLLAVPLFLAGLVYADRHLEGVASWRVRGTLFVWTLAFYLVHAQFAFLFAGAVVWLHLCNRSGITALRQVGTPLVVGAATCGGFASATLRDPGIFEQSMIAAPVFKTLGERLAPISELVFGAHAQYTNAVVALFALLLLALALSRSAAPGRASRKLYDLRFLSLGGWVWFLYFVMPLNVGQYLVQERLAPVAAALVLISLPRFDGARIRIAQGLLAALLFVQWAGVCTGALIFEEEAAGIEEVLEPTEPGKKLMGLVQDRRSVTLRHPDVFLHFPALYQVYKGGHVNFSFAELVHSVASPLPGKSFHSILAEVEPRNLKNFSLDRHGVGFDYFLVRGSPDDVRALVGDSQRKLQVRSSGRWHLLW